MWAHRVSRVPFSSIQNHDNTEQARIYPAKLKHIVPRRQSAIIAGLNKCKILTGTNASNGSRTRGYIFPFVPLLWLACICVQSRPTTQDAWGGASKQRSPAAAWCSSLKWMRAGVDIKQGKLRVRFHHRFGFNWFYIYARTERAKAAGCTPQLRDPSQGAKIRKPWWREAELDE